MAAEKNVFSELYMCCMSNPLDAKYWSQGQHSSVDHRLFSPTRERLNKAAFHRESLVEYSAMEFVRISQQLLTVFQ